MNKRILFNTWSGAFFNMGGGEVQLLKSREYLEKSGYAIELFDMWSPQTDIDILHQFSVQFGVETVVNNYSRLGYKIALSPITWTIPNKDELHYHHIRNLFVDSEDPPGG